MAKSTMNRFFWHTFNSLNESVIEKLRISHLSLKIQNYIKEVVGTTEALLGKDSIHAVMLFGSVPNGETTKLSDVDLIILTKNLVSNRKLKEIKPFLIRIVIKHKYLNYNPSWDAKILHAIERRTGMFCSIFVTNLEAWENKKFSSIFSTSKILTQIIAPNKIVLDSMKAGSTILYNADEIDLQPSESEYSFFQIIKSLILNLLMSLGTLFLLVINKKYVKYMLESIKWSIRCCDFYRTRKTRPLSKIILEFHKLGVSRDFLQKFLYLRNYPTQDLLFSLKVPYNIIKIHLKTLKYHKY